MENMRDLVAAQRTFFNSNTTKDIPFRIRQLKKLREALKANEKQMYAAIYEDFGKSEFDTYTTELALIYMEINEAIRKVRSWSDVEHVRTNLVNFPAKSYVIPEPLGVSLIIGAWNYPYQLSLAPVISALSAGCTVLLKPSELPSRTSAVMANIINTTFAANYFHVVEGGIPETTALLDQKFDKIFFTGSVPVGKIVYQAAAKHLTPVTLELGGKSPAFVTESAQLKMTVKRLIWSKFLNGAQTCIAPDYVLVHSSIKEAFLQMAKEEVAKSNFSVENGNYTRIINERNFDRLIGFIDAEKVVCGGSYNRETLHIDPTLLQNVDWEHPIMDDEVFGPILPIIEYTNLDDAIQSVKDRPKPLACYVFTSNRKHKKKVLHELSFGNGGVNDAVMQITNPNYGFGGVGNSGMGAYHGKHGFDAFSHKKAILDKPTWFETNLKYYPHSAFKFKWIKRMLR